MLIAVRRTKDLFRFIRNPSDLVLAWMTTIRRGAYELMYAMQRGVLGEGSNVAAAAIKNARVAGNK